MLVNSVVIVYTLSICCACLIAWCVCFVAVLVFRLLCWCLDGLCTIGVLVGVLFVGCLFCDFSGCLL